MEAITRRGLLLPGGISESTDRRKPRLAASVDVRNLGDRKRLSVTCGEKKERKEKRKLVKGLEKDLGLFSAMRFGINPRTGLAGEVVIHESMIKEAAEVLLKQLQWLREAEEEARKRRKREKRRKEKAMQLLDEDVGSETHTDSGDGECERSTDFDNSSSWREQALSSKEAETLGESIVAELVVRVLLEGLDRVKKEERCAGTSLEFLNVSSDDSLGVQEVLAFTEANVAKAVGQSLIHALASQQESKLQQTDRLGGKKVEICIGGKCRKSGGWQLLEQIHKLLAEKEDVEVVGCKCMGKCKSGPNLRLSATNAAPAICSGVDISEVHALVASFLDLK